MMRYRYLLPALGFMLGLTMFPQEGWVARVADTVEIDQTYRLTDAPISPEAKAFLQSWSPKRLAVTLENGGPASGAAPVLTVSYVPAMTGPFFALAGQALDRRTEWPIAAGPQYSASGTYACDAFKNKPPENVTFELVQKKYLGFVKTPALLTFAFSATLDGVCRVGITFGPLLEAQGNGENFGSRQ